MPSRDVFETSSDEEEGPLRCTDRRVMPRALVVTGVVFIVMGMMGLFGVFDGNVASKSQGRHPYEWYEDAHQGQPHQQGAPHQQVAPHQQAAPHPKGAPSTHQPGSHHPTGKHPLNQTLNRSHPGSHGRTVVPAPEPDQDPGNGSSRMTCPMFQYTGRKSGADACFCNKAHNPACTKPDSICHCVKEGCDVSKTGVDISSEAVSFFSFPNVQNCKNKERVLTIPRSFFANIVDLRKKCGLNGTAELLEQMLLIGFQRYHKVVGNYTVTQCIHKPTSVSVHWLHLHTFCKGGRADGMPSQRSSICGTMSTSAEAHSIARSFVEFTSTQLHGARGVQGGHGAHGKPGAHDTTDNVSVANLAQEEEDEEVEEVEDNDTFVEETLWG